MKKKFLLNIALLVFLNLLVKPLWIFIEIEVQNKVGTEQYGLYFALFNLTLIFNILLDAGIVNYNNKEIAGNPKLIEKYTNKLIPLRAALAVIYLVFIFGAGWILSYNAQALFILATLGFNQLLLSLVLYLRSNLQGLHFFRSDSLVSVADRVIMCAVILYLLIAMQKGEFNIMWLIYAQSAGYGIALLMATIFLMAHSKLKFKLRFDLAFSIVFLKKCMPYALIGILMLLYNFADAVMLERMLPNGDEAAGLYAQSVRILIALSNFSYLFSLLLLPMFAKMIAKKEKLNELLHLSVALLTLSAIFIACSCALFSNEIIFCLYGKSEGISMLQRFSAAFNGENISIQNAAEVSQSAQIFFYVILTFIPISTLYVFGTLLTAAGEMKWLNTTAAIGVAVNLIGNYFLIPLYGALGSAVICFGTQCLVCILQVGVVRKKFNLKTSTKSALRYLLTLLLFTAVAWLFRQSQWPWPWQIMCDVSAGLLIATMCKAIPLPGISKMVRLKNAQ